MVRSMMVAACLAALGLGTALAQGQASFPGPRLLGAGESLEALPVKPNACREVGMLLKRLVCNVTVTATDEARCQVKVDPKAFLVTRAGFRRKDVTLVWTLKSAGGSPAAQALSFDPTAGIDILQGTTKEEWEDLAIAGDDDGNDLPITVPPTLPRPPFHRVKVTGKDRVGSFPFAYHYNINILRYSALLGQWVPCGGIDPLIVNTD